MKRGMVVTKKAAPVKRADPPPVPALVVPPRVFGKYAGLARAKLKRIVIEEPEREYFSTGDKLIDEIFGVPGKGIFTGSMVELRGDSSSGKSLLGAEVAARLLSRGAIVHWVDVECSWSDPWMAARGLAREYTNLYQPFHGIFTGDTGEDGKQKMGVREVQKMLADPKQRAALIEAGRMESAEEIIADLETGVRLAHIENPDAFQYIVMDSVAALVTDEEINTDLEDRNMRTKLSLTGLTNSALKRWMGFLPQNRAAVLLLNQTRINPTKVTKYSDGAYSAGGRPMIYYPQIRIELNRKSGFLTSNGNVIGICGKLKVFKNKADGKEGRIIAYKLPYKAKGFLETID